jgi:hypothetical protein
MPGVGRKVHRLNGFVGIRFDNDMKRFLDEVAWQRRCSLSDLIREFVTKERLLAWTTGVDKQSTSG